MVAKAKDRDEGKTLQTGAGSSTMTPWSEMERWFNDVGRHGWLHPFSWDWPSRAGEGFAPFEGRMPKVDMVEHDDEIVVRAELPGVKKDDVEVTLAENTVMIEAQTSHEEKEEKGKYYRREMSRGNFRRTLALPVGVDDSKARASFTDGVLELTLPKAEKASGKKVEVE